MIRKTNEKPGIPNYWHFRGKQRKTMRFSSTKKPKISNVMRWHLVQFCPKEIFCGENSKNLRENSTLRDFY